MLHKKVFFLYEMDVTTCHCNHTITFLNEPLTVKATDKRTFSENATIKHAVEVEILAQVFLHLVLCTEWTLVHTKRSQNDWLHSVTVVIGLYGNSYKQK